ncbi:hypothetical protein PUNSTDRAFT_135247 [Punctularia strigosozonata HHB-11173 SS5]|uniref:uncharacterized protein n=1 Tax=Punctularia strigosozonata (strain HHB-11173) TaxID=741275 RepID=UPI00044176DE|nr:uncharacterized protein PUNSTDRAFT_135247 [Punctularia strigosozonata HHB-11173 SS5]EIN07725.1 hypothetical protein PUNSTDRAFT_135247 [Punctularia strigosozonata HHB-11173 SS5]
MPSAVKVKSVGSLPWATGTHAASAHSGAQDQGSLVPGKSGIPVSPVSDPAEEASVDQDETLGDAFCQTVGRSSRFFIPDGNLRIIVADTEYQVHRYFFLRDSDFFRRLVCKQCSSHAIPVICLFDINCNEFDLFLDIFYRSDYIKYMAETLADWTAILRLSTTWGFRSIRELAIRECFPLALPVDRIALGRRYNIPGWLKDAYVAICQRDEPLTLQEAEQLELDDVIAISERRQRIRDARVVVPGETVVSTVVSAFSSRFPAEESDVPANPAPLTPVPREDTADDTQNTVTTKGNLKKRGNR